MTGELISLFDHGPPDPAGQPRALTLPPPPAGWPAPPDPVAYHGLSGAIVAKIAPNTEADPAAILTQLLVCAGALIGRDAYFQVEATRHHPNEFVVLVGDSAKARKGSSFDHVARLLSHADPAFTARQTTGLSSGEGLIWAVRDPAGPDSGAIDKRLLVIEAEFATVLKSTGRELSTLSPTLRSAWDGRPLALLTEQPRRAPPRRTSRSSATSPRRHGANHHRRDRQRVPQPVLLRPSAASGRSRRRRPQPAERHPPRPLPDHRSQARARRRESHTHPRRQGAVVAALPAAHPPRRRSPRTTHRPRRSARDPPRAPLHAARRTKDDPTRASPSRARALELRAALRRLGARTDDR